jgi:hypothetical protein
VREKIIEQSLLCHVFLSTFRKGGREGVERQHPDQRQRKETTMDDGTLRHQAVNVVFIGHFVWGDEAIL